MRNLLNSLIKIVIVALLAPLAFSIPAIAQYASPNYKVDELFLGSGGTNNASSSSFQGRASIGDLGVGASASTAYLAFGGFTTTAAPELELDVGPLNVDLGVLSTATTAFTSTTFKVRTYLASNYVIFTNGAAPTSENGSVISPLTSGGTSTPGTSQFGINLTVNTTPAVGANPVQLPDNTFSFGTVATNYNTANTFRYNDGDAIAQSASSSGITQYTISYIFNINGSTAAGQYTFKQSIVAVSTF